jgi:multiple sugar transport system permease protein
MAYAVWLSLHQWDGLSVERPFIGLENYTTLLREPEFWNSVQITVVYTVGVTVLSLVGGLLLALALNTRLHGRSIYRAVFFTPVVTAMVAAAVVWNLLFDQASGFINVSLRGLGIAGPGWLTDPHWALPSLILVGAWKRIGFNMVIYLAGLQTIPMVYREAAMIDGAGALRIFRSITWPLLTPITVLLVIMSVIEAFQAFDQVFIMTAGGPLGSTEVLPLYLYTQGFHLFHLGYAAAVGWVIFAVVFIATIFQWRLTGGGGWRR